MGMPRRLTVVACLALSALALIGCDPLDKSELRREVDAIGSAATEGGMLAKEVADDRTKATFVRVHAGELADSVDESAQKLNDADIQPGIRDQANKAIGLATKASDLLGELEVEPGDEQTGERVHDDLEQVSSAADALSAGL